MTVPLIIKAREYLLKRNLSSEENVQKMIHTKTFFWQYLNSRWMRFTEEELINDIIALANEDSAFLSSPTSKNCGEIARILQAICSIKDLKDGTFINEPHLQGIHYIPLQNGILKTTISNGEMGYELLPITHKFFAGYTLPYEYNIKAECQIFMKYLLEIQEQEEIDFLQELFGYCLLPVNYANKFFFFWGQGSNGKSVLCLLLRLLVGKENVSHVPIQGFTFTSDFCIPDTEGKLINLVEETDDVRDFPTGYLKDYITGGPIRIERKFKDAYDIVTTARLIFATNIIPQFKDDTDGFMRRLMILPFKRQFLDETKQDKRFSDKDFWLESNELSGIFLWALNGLGRLMKNNWKFTEPESMKEVLSSYKEVINPILQFLEDNVEFSISGELAVYELYSQYQKHCASYGYNKENANAFGRSVRKVFPQATQSKNTLTRNGKRTRVWYGIKIKNDSPTNENFATPLTQATHRYEPIIVFNSENTNQEVFCANTRAS